MNLNATLRSISAAVPTVFKRSYVVEADRSAASHTFMLKTRLQRTTQGRHGDALTR